MVCGREDQEQHANPYPPNLCFPAQGFPFPWICPFLCQKVEVMQSLRPSTYVLVPRPALQISVAILGTSKDTGPDTSIQR